MSRTVRIVGEFKSLDDVKNIVVTTASGAQVKLKDIATVRDGFHGIDNHSSRNLRLLQNQLQCRCKNDVHHAGIPIVSGSTGWNDRYPEAVTLCQQLQGTLFYSSNYSIGVNIFFRVNEFLASLMGKVSGYSVAVDEIHHTQKLDAPSGTAITLAELMTLKYAFAKSINSIAVQLTQQITPKKVIEYAHKMGITSPLADVPSVCLGSSDVSLYEMVNSYCTIVNGGYKVEPILVTRIENSKGEVIYDAKQGKSAVLTPVTAFYMYSIDCSYSLRIRFQISENRSSLFAKAVIPKVDFSNTIWLFSTSVLKKRLWTYKLEKSFSPYFSKICRRASPKP